MRYHLHDEPAGRAPENAMRRGFTLIELLGVIAIIALLVGVLLPALGAARRAGMTAACLSNMRQLALAQAMYADDGDGALVDAGMPHGGLDIGSFGSLWITALSDYYGSAEVVKSPVDDSPFWAIADGGDDAGMTLGEFLGFYDRNRSLLSDGDPDNNPAFQRARWNSYGLNNMITASFSPLRAGYLDPVTGRVFGGAETPFANLNRIPRPTQTAQWLMMVRVDPVAAPEAGFAKSDHVHVEDWSPGMLPIPANVFSPSKASEQMDTAAHGGDAGTAGGRANFAFLDGHAETRRFSEMYKSEGVNRFHPEAGTP